jgi:hypothetical protein
VEKDILTLGVLVDSFRESNQIWRTLYLDTDQKTVHAVYACVLLDRRSQTFEYCGVFGIQNKTAIV